MRHSKKKTARPSHVQVLGIIALIAAVGACKTDAVSDVQDSFVAKGNQVARPESSRLLGTGFDSDPVYQGPKFMDEQCVVPKVVVAGGKAKVGDEPDSYAYTVPGGVSGVAPTTVGASTAGPAASGTAAAVGASLTDTVNNTTDELSAMPDDVIAAFNAAIDGSLGESTSGGMPVFATSDLDSATGADLASNLGDLPVLSGIADAIGDNPTGTTMDLADPGIAAAASASNIPDHCTTERLCVTFNVYNSQTSAANSMSGSARLQYTQTFGNLSAGGSASGSDAKSGNSQYLVGRIRFLASAPHEDGYFVTPKAAALISSAPDLSSFRSLCGTSYTRARIDGAEIYVIAEINGNDAQKKTGISADATAGTTGAFKIVTGDLKGSAKIDRAASTMDGMTSSNIQGFSNPANLMAGQIPTDMRSVSQMLKIMSGFLPVEGASINVTTLGYTLQGYEAMSGVDNKVIAALLPPPANKGQLFPPPKPTPTPTPGPQAAAPAYPACTAQFADVKPSFVNYHDAIGICGRNGNLPRLMTRECIDQPQLLAQVLTVFNANGGIDQASCLWLFDANAPTKQSYWSPAYGKNAAQLGVYSGGKCYTACTN